VDESIFVLDSDYKRVSYKYLKIEIENLMASFDI
jgi:hypothetical protein